MKYTAVAIGVASMLMPAGIALAQDTGSTPVPPPPAGDHRPLPPRPNAMRMMGTTTRPAVMPSKGMDDKMGSTSRDGRPMGMGEMNDHEGMWATSTGSTTPPIKVPHRYKPSDVRSFLKWIFALPASTTVGELRDRIDATGLMPKPTRQGAMAYAPIQSMDLISGFLAFFGFGGTTDY